MTRNLPAEAAWIQHIAEHVRMPTTRGCSEALCPLPAPVRYGVRALVPQRLRRALVRRLRQLAK